MAVHITILNHVGLRLLCIALSLVGVFTLSAQGTIQEFGKNRVQYNEDFKNWNEYESRSFFLYYYGKSREIASVVSQLAEVNNEDIRRRLEYRFNEKIDLIVYADLVDFNQSNLGNEDIFRSGTGETKVINSKMLVYYTGDPRVLKRQIREGITRIYLEQMQVGSSIQEFVQNAVSSDLPVWYTQGIISYMGEAWYPELDNSLRQLLLSGEYDGFYDFARDHPKLAGHLFWAHVQEKYGGNVFANLLYLNRINRNLETSFLYSLGTGPEILAEKAFQEYLTKYAEEEARWMPLPENCEIEADKNKHLPYAAVAVHPNNSTLAYITMDIGKYRVFVRDNRGERELKVKRGSRNPFQPTDPHNPLLAWNPSGQILGMIYERRDRRYFQYWNLRTGEKGRVRMSSQIERIYSFDFISNGELVLSASERGYVDLYRFTLRNRNLERLTEDYFDNHDVSFAQLGGRKGILFSSNRPNTLLIPQRRDTSVLLNNFDLFFFDLTPDAERIDRLTRTPDIDEQQPMQDSDGSLYYRATHSGLQHLFKGKLYSNLDTVGTAYELSTGRVIRLSEKRRLLRIDPKLIENERPWIDTVYTLSPANLTNYGTHITSLDVAGGRVAFSVPYRKTHRLFLCPVTEFEPKKIIPTIHTVNNKDEQRKREKNQRGNSELSDPAPKKPEKVYKFQSPFPDPAQLPAPPSQTQKNKISEVLLLNALTSWTPKERPYPAFNPTKSYAYRLRFKFENFVTRMDNEPLFGGLNTFAGQPQGFSFPPLGLLGKFTVTDLFEDYEITAGVRFPTTFNGSEYFIYFDNNKKRWDKRYALYRRAQKESFQDGLGRPVENRNIDLIGIFQLRYPLDIFRSFRITTTARFDTYNVLSTNRPTLDVPPENVQRLGVKGAYVFDNSFWLMKNMLQGTRYKFWIEFMNRYKVQFSPSEFSWSDGFMTILGVDARHYIPVGRHAVLAGRIAGSASFGSEQLLFFMGGVDNWLFAENNENISIPMDGNFAFETLAGNMRGFNQNARNGSSYIVSNLEFRVAPFNYLSRKPLRSTFWRNLQLVAFADVGTAWYGISPFSEDNPLNTITVENPPTVEVTVNYFKDPLLIGFGGCSRADLFGYFIRVDYAWGLETRVLQDPILYISLGLDF